MAPVSLKRPSPQVIFASEIPELAQALFQRAPLYLGNTQHSPTGYLRVPPWAPDVYLSCPPGRNQVSVNSNICLHWQANILEPTQADGFMPHNKSLLCRSHNAVYASESGRLLNAHLFKQSCEYRLPAIATVEWNGFLFRQPQWENMPGPFNLADELAIIERESEGLINTSGYSLGHSMAMEQAGNWAMFMLNYLDLLHVPPAHAETLNQLCNCNIMTSFPGLQFDHERNKAGRWSTIQKVGVKATWGEGETDHWDDPQNPLRGKAAFHHWGKIYKALNGTPPWGSIWTTTFPHLMFEWYPGVIVASQVFPHTTDTTRCWVYHDFYYDNALLEACPYFVELHQVAFHSTGDEDEWMVGNSSRNLQRLAQQGIQQEMGFVHPELEDCAPLYYARLAEVWGDLRHAKKN